MPTTTPFANLITFSRGSNATVVGPDGLVQWAPNNLVTFSEQFDNAAWSKTAVTVTANAAVAPDGTTTADALVETTATSTHQIFRLPGLGVNTYTYSFYAKASGRTQVQVEQESGGNARFTLTGTGTALALGANTVSITSVGNGWYRCSTTFTVTGAFGVYLLLYNGSTNNYTGDGTSGVLLWGAQLELGTAATTYNPTTVKNLLGFSEAFDNAAWTKGGASIVTGAQANPVNGLFNAQKLMEDTSASNTHIARQTVSNVPASPVVFSVYVKAAGRSFVRLVDASYGNGAYFNLANATVGTTDSATGSITDVGNGWYRCSLFYTSTVAGSHSYDIRVANAATGGSDTYTGDGNSGVFIYGAQLSDSASLDPYVPTPGAAPSSTAYYGPRFDYDPVTRAARGILIEEQRTNRTLQSENFTVSPWDATVTGTSTRVNDGSPLGFTRALVTATSALGGIRQAHSGLTGGQVYALSFYIQSAATSVLVAFENGAAGFGAVHNVTINPSNGTAGALTGFTSVNIQPFGPGYVYTLITAAAGGTLNANIEWRITNNGDSIWLGRPQFEAGAFATSYIPTIASTVTRNGDSLFLSGQNFAQWYRQDEGAWYAEFSAFDPSQNGATFTVSDGTSSNRFIGYPASSVQMEVTTGGVLQASLDGGTITTDTNAKVAFAYAVNNLALSLSGGAVVSDTSATIPTVNQSRIGANVGGGSLLNGWFRNLRYIPVRAADFQLQALTT